MTKSIDEFNEILQRDFPLSSVTWLRTGGAAELYLTPRTEEELCEVVSSCRAQSIPIHVLGSGSNLLVRDEGVRGAVIRISEPLLCDLEISGNILTAGGGCQLSHVVSEAARRGLAGMEHLVGIPGTLGGAIVGNSGGRHGDIGQVVRSVRVLTQDGQVAERGGDELSFAYRRSTIQDLVILGASFELTADDSDELLQRIRRNWIMKRSTQPLADQSAGCIFRNPRGLSAGALIEQSGLKGVTCGKARISERHANFIVTDAGATSADVEGLIEQVRAGVSAKFSVDLDLEIQVW